MPTAAVIPASIAYTKVVAIKKLVVGSQVWAYGSSLGGYCCFIPSYASWLLSPRCSSFSVFGGQNVYFEAVAVPE